MQTKTVPVDMGKLEPEPVNKIKEELIDLIEAYALAKEVKNRILINLAGLSLSTYIQEMKVQENPGTPAEGGKGDGSN